MNTDRMLRHRWATREELIETTGKSGFLYHHPSWWRAVEDGLGYSCVGIVSDLGADAAILVPHFRSKKGPFHLIGSPLRGSMTPFQRAIRTGNVSQRQELDAVIGQTQFLRTQGFSWVEWGFEGDAAMAEALEGSVGAGRMDRMTFHLEIKPDIEGMWGRMEKQGRNMVRKAEKAGVSIRRCVGTESELHTFYALLTGTFAKSGTLPPHPQSFYRACIKHLAPEGRLLFLAAEVAGRIIAMGFFPHDNEQIHYMSGTSLPGTNQFAPNNLIQWEVVRFAVESKLKIYDLGGIGIPAIDRFKASLGGQIHRFPVVTWKSPASAAAEKIFIGARAAAAGARTWLREIGKGSA